MVVSAGTSQQKGLSVWSPHVLPEYAWVLWHLAYMLDERISLQLTLGESAIVDGLL